MRGKKETLWIEDTPMFKDQRHEEPAETEKEWTRQKRRRTEENWGLGDQLTEVSSSTEQLLHDLLLTGGASSLFC